MDNRQETSRNVWRIVIVTSILTCGLLMSCGDSEKASDGKSMPVSQENLNQIAGGHVGSESCKECHVAEFASWAESHHGLAERPLDPQLDASAFVPTRHIGEKNQQSTISSTNGVMSVRTWGVYGEPENFPVERVIGVDPLRQFLVQGKDGRLQVLELAFDPKRKEWFDVFGHENRHPGEWGHWTGRGMNWNSMCADCHNTAFRKNYDPESDAFQSNAAEMGVGCEACHGPMGGHVEWQRSHPGQSSDPTLPVRDRERDIQTCATCHSLRTELTGEFLPGESYADHFSLVLPDETNRYYADGQVHDEDYEYAAFRGSRMYEAGVRCVDCHDPHSGKTVLKGNDLCLKCHAGQRKDAPLILPQEHLHHTADKPGGRCLDCHMPVTVYMQRHQRHDHGFTLPAPRMTREHGIPNACNRCHEKESVDWAIRKVDEWYGPPPHPDAVRRTDLIGRLREGDRTVISQIIKLARNEKHPYWRAVLTGLLRSDAGHLEVESYLKEAVRDPEALVREAALKSLEPLLQRPSENGTVEWDRLWNDPVRSVRLAAAWAGRRRLEMRSDVGGELTRYFQHNADQPAMSTQLGNFYFDRGDSARALAYFQKAVQWDSTSAAARYNLAVASNLSGNQKEVLKQLRMATQLAPQQGDYWFAYGLALGEAGDLALARNAFQNAVKYRPELDRAWYNLGLAKSEEGHVKEALADVQQAEKLNSSQRDYPYALATLYLKLKRTHEAEQALRRALAVDPQHQPSQQLLNRLEKGTPDE